MKTRITVFHGNTMFVSKWYTGKLEANSILKLTDDLWSLSGNSYKFTTPDNKIVIIPESTLCNSVVVLEQLDN